MPQNLDATPDNQHRQVVCTSSLFSATDMTGSKLLASQEAERDATLRQWTPQTALDVVPPQTRFQRFDNLRALRNARGPRQNTASLPAFIPPIPPPPKKSLKRKSSKLKANEKQLSDVLREFPRLADAMDWNLTFDKCLLPPLPKAR